MKPPRKYAAGIQGRFERATDWSLERLPGPIGFTAALGLGLAWFAFGPVIGALERRRKDPPQG